MRTRSRQRRRMRKLSLSRGSWGSSMVRLRMRGRPPTSRRRPGGRWCWWSTRARWPPLQPRSCTGSRAFGMTSTLQGVIYNRVGSDRHAELLDRGDGEDRGSRRSGASGGIRDVGSARPASRARPGVRAPGFGGISPGCRGSRRGGARRGRPSSSGTEEGTGRRDQSEPERSRCGTFRVLVREIRQKGPPTADGRPGLPWIERVVIGLGC